MSGGPQPLPFIPLPGWLGTPLAAGGFVDEDPKGGTGAGDASDPAKKLQAIKDLLKKSATGAAAVKFFDDNKLVAEFASGGGSYWNGSKMVINADHSVERAALAVVHEVNHARSTLDGTKPDPKKDTRDDYVRKMLAEETRGTVDSIRTKHELVAAGVAITATYPYESTYNKAYTAATEALKKADPAATADALKAAGDKAGHDAVLKKFVDGEAKGSGSGKPYTEIYGSRWDKHNPTK